MTDQEFIALLNLYVDHEISPQDALRLESAVAASPRRREIYDQYCRMQKACSLLSEHFSRSTSSTEYEPRAAWGFGQVMAGLAAACILLVVGLRFRGALASAGSAPVASAPVAAAAPAAVERPALSDGMEPVFSVRPPAAQAPRGASGSLFASADPLSPASQLNWIGAINLGPVPPATSSDFLLASRTDLKAAAVADPQAARDAQQPSEMAAFRFQR